MRIERGDARSSRCLEAEFGTYRATVAWRGAASGRSLLYFLALEDGEPGDDRRDRRAPLETGRALEEFSADELRELLSEGKPLTDTERRFRAPDGRLWLAQSVGPVWADRDPAEGSTGLVFTSLEGAFERLRGPGEHAGRAGREELADLWRRAAAAEEEGEGDGGDGEP